MMGTKVKTAVPFILVSLLFMMWGIANNMNDTLLAAFKRIMSMSDFQTSLVQFSFYGAYFCFALPAAVFISRHSFKSGILLGLLLYAAGTMLFYPAGEVGSYPFFLCAIYVMAGGCAILETTANPYILSMGNPEKATQRLNIAQTFNPIGAVIGILLSRHFILSELNEAGAAERAGMDGTVLMAIQQNELNAVSGTYLIIGCTLLVLFAVILLTKMPSDSDKGKITGICATLRKLSQNKRYRNGVVAQFFYVGAQTGVWSFTIRLAMSELGINEKDASLCFLCSILAFTGFRVIFTWLMGVVAPRQLLAASAATALLLTLAVTFSSGMAAVCCMVAISACMSLMFPTIYGESLQGITGETAKIAGAGQIMAILGGALITPLQALVSDAFGIGFSFAIPAVCFTVILLYSSSTLGKTAVKS